MICDRKITAAPREEDGYSCVCAREALTGADAMPLKIQTPTVHTARTHAPGLLPTFADGTTLFLSGGAISFSWPRNLVGCGDK